MVVLVVSLRILFTVNIKLIIESQPLLLVSVSLYVPAAVMALPLQVYGSWLVQMVVLVVSLSMLFTVNIKLIIESQPPLLVSVSLYVPAALMVLPLQLYGS
jgi:hypothetical protein